MLPVNLTHALATARAEEVQRRTERAHLSSTGAAAPSRLATALRTLSGRLRGALVPARPAAARATSARSTAVCCA